MIGAVVLAAGKSSRMGRPKLVLPWGKTSVIGRVVQVLSQAGIEEIVVVTGGAQKEVEAALSQYPVETVYNPLYQEDAMLLSLQVGLSRLSPEIQAALIVLGDQPQIQEDVVRAIVRCYQQEKAVLVVPSYNFRRGHPWIVDQQLWKKILSFHPPVTLRDVLRSFSRMITYLEVGTDTIMRDLDTPEDYQRESP